MKNFIVTLNEKQAKDLVCWVKWTNEDMAVIESHYRQRVVNGSIDGNANDFKEMMDSVLQLIETLET